MNMFEKWIAKITAQRKAKLCHAISYDICQLGYNNGKAQSLIDEAKDCLYGASIIFREGAEKNFEKKSRKR